MNPSKLSLFIFLIIAGICILSILASPSVPRRQEATSTTESPVDDEDGPESDQLLLRKRNVPANDQEEGTTTQQTPPSDQWLFSIRRKRQVRPRGQEASSTTQDPFAAEPPPSDQWDVPEHLRQGAKDQSPSGPASDQLARRKRQIGGRRQGGASTTQDPFAANPPPSDQRDVPEHLRQNGQDKSLSDPASDQLARRKRQIGGRLQEVSSTTQDPLAAGPPPSDQLIDCPHCGGFGRRRRQAPPRLHGQETSTTTQDPFAAAPPSDQGFGFSNCFDTPTCRKRQIRSHGQANGPRGQEASTTTEDPFAAAGPPSDQIAAPIEDRRKRQVPPRSPLRGQGGSSTTQVPPAGPASDQLLRDVPAAPPSNQLTKRSAALQKRSPQYNMMAPPPQAWPVMPMPWQQPPPPQMGWPGPVPPPIGGEWPGGQPSPAVSGGMWPVPPPWPQQPTVAKA